MNPEYPSWTELRRKAAENLPADLSTRVLARAASVRRARREIVATSVTLVLCLAFTVLTSYWTNYQKHEENLASWNQLSAVTVAVDQGL